MPSLSLSTYAHLVPDDLPLGEDLLEVLGAQDAAEGGLGSEVGGVDGVLHGHHRLDGVTDAEEDNGVHTAGDRVPGEDLEERERERERCDVCGVVVFCGHDYTSCGGTSKVTVLRFTTRTSSMHGRTKNKPAKEAIISTHVGGR